MTKAKTEFLIRKKHKNGASTVIRNFLMVVIGFSAVAIVLSVNYSVIQTSSIEANSMAKCYNFDFKPISCLYWESEGIIQIIPKIQFLKGEREFVFIRFLDGGR